MTERGEGMKAMKIKNLSGEAKRRIKAVLLFVCTAATLALPAACGSLFENEEPVISQAASVDSVDLPLVGASAFAEARKSMTASNPEAKDQFSANIEAIVGGEHGVKWQNLGLLLGPKDALSGTAWNTFLSPSTLSVPELQNYNSPGLTVAYEKYKSFGSAIESLNAKAKKKPSSAHSVTDSLDSMSAAALKLGNFGVKFLAKYNPAPVVLSFYDSSNLSTYSDNELVKIVSNNQIMKQIVCLFGDKVAGTNLSFFLIINAVVAVIGFALSLFLTLMGNQAVGDGMRKFLSRIVIGTVGIYLIGNLMSVMLEHVGETVLNQEAWEEASFVEENLNFYDWYMTGFSLPNGTTITINKKDQFQLDSASIRAINYYTYERLTGTPADQITDTDIKERMEKYAENGNSTMASFITPTYTAGTLTGGEGEGEAWATDAYYAIMDNFSKNTDLLEGADSESSPLHSYAGREFSLSISRYLWMSSLNMNDNGDGSWSVNMPVVFLPGFGTRDNYYGLNPISAYNVLRTGFRGNNVAPVSTAYPVIGCVAYDIVDRDSAAESRNMNSILRFIATFSIMMAALKGMITIFAAGFGGMISGGIKTAIGSSHGLGQAIGGIIAIFGGLIGISLILSVDMTLLDELYGIAYDLIHSNEILDSILEPIEEAVGDIALIGDLIMSACRSIAGFILTLIFSLTFPKLGAIPINTFCQYMADLPGKIAERAQMIEGQLMSGRSSAGGGLGPRGGMGRGGGAYGKMATAQASQALASGQRQAGAVLAAGAAGMAALGGAGLSALGRTLNNKGDKVEGKPKNPGMDNWNELSPEQQSAAAAAAADSGDKWDDMDQDARQKAMEEKMEAQDMQAEEAQAASEADRQREDDEFDSMNEAAASEEGYDVPEDSAGIDGTDGADADGADGADAEGLNGTDAESLDGLDGADVAGVSEEDSMNGSGSSLDGEDMRDPGAAGEEDSLNSGSQDTSDENGPGTASQEDSMNTAQGNPADTAGMENSLDNEAAANVAGASESDSMNVGENPDDMPDVTGASQEDSMNSTETGTENSDADMAASSSLDTQAGTDGNAASDTDGQSLNEGSGDENVANYNNSLENATVEQKVDNDIKANADTKNVDNSSLTEEGGESLNSPGMDKDGNPAQAAAASMGDKDSAAKGLNHDGNGGAGGNMTMNANSSQTAKMQNNQATNINAMRADKSSATSINKAGNQASAAAQAGQKGAGSQTRRPTGTRQGAAARQNAGQQGRQGMNSAAKPGTQASPAARGNAQQAKAGTARSPYGKDMSINDQRKARILHAVGDGLQMAGGNRTLGDGLKDAMGHMKDAAVAYAVPEEYAGAILVNSIRDKRQRREQRLKQMQRHNAPANKK